MHNVTNVSHSICNIIILLPLWAYKHLRVGKCIIIVGLSVNLHTSSLRLIKLEQDLAKTLPVSSD